jgi:hypothetical protein
MRSWWIAAGMLGILCLFAGCGGSSGNQTASPDEVRAAMEVVKTGRPPGATPKVDAAGSTRRKPR